MKLKSTMNWRPISYNTARTGWKPVSQAMVLALLIVSVSAEGATRVAILTTAKDASSGNVAALVEAELSQGNDFTVLERQQVDRILSEQKLSLSGMVEADQAVKVGKILSCQLLVILEPEAGTAQFGLVNFDPTTGVRLSDLSVSAESATKAAEVVESAVRSADHKRRGVNELRTVCLMTVRNADLPRDMDGFCDAVGRLLERNLVGSSSVALLDRSRLEQVTRERALAADAATDKLLASVIVLELQIERHAQGLRATALISDTAGKSQGTVFSDGSLDDASGLAEAVGKELSRSLKVPAAPRLDIQAEAARFHSEWNFRSQNRDFLRALAPAEAAHALEPGNLIYRSALAEALIAHGFALYRGYDYTPHASTQPWERHDLVPPSLTRGAQLLAQITPRPAPAKGAPPDAVREHCLNAAAELRRFIASATWFQTSGADRTPLPSSDVAQVKRLFREFLLKDNSQSLATVKERASFLAYCPHFVRLLSDNEWIYSVNPDRWTADFEQSATTWLGLLKKYPGTDSDEVVEALDAITVGWQFENHAGGTLYGGSEVGRRTRRWDPNTNQLERMRNVERILESDPGPLVQWYGRLLGLSIEVTPFFHAQDRLRQSVGEFIDRIAPNLAKPEFAKRPDVRRALYHILIQADTLLDTTQWKGEMSNRLLDISLSRHEIVPDVISRALRPFRSKMVADPADTARQIKIYERVLKEFDSPSHVVFGFQNSDLARNIYLKELDRLRVAPKVASTEPTTRPWYSRRELINVFRATQGVRALFEPIVDGEYVDLLGAQPINNEIQSVRLQLLRIPLDGGPIQRLGMLPTSDVLHLQPDGLHVGAIITASCLAEGRYCASTSRDGIFIFPTDGHFPLRLNPENGLPDAHGGPIAMLDGHLYGALGREGSETYIIEYNFSTKQIDVIASTARKDKRSPLDDQEGVRIVGLSADDERHRLIVTIAHRGESPQLSGLWEYKPQTQQWRRLVAVHLFEQQNELRTRESGAYIGRVLRPHNGALPFVTGGRLYALDLNSDQVFALEKVTDPDPVLPAQTPLWKSITPAGVEAFNRLPVARAFEHRALVDPWLWGVWGRTNLSTGQTQNIDFLRSDGMINMDLVVEPTDDGARAVLGNRMRLSVLTVAP